MDIVNLNILDNTAFKLENGTYDLDKSVEYGGRMAGICYSKEGLPGSLKEDSEKAIKRATSTARNGHQSVFDHTNITLQVKGPKILNMILNNEGQYNTTERSLRYVEPTSENTTYIDPVEMELYKKWYDIFYKEIEKKVLPHFIDLYGEKQAKFKCRNYAKENARYILSVFTETEMVHTIPLAQLNREITYMEKYLKETPYDNFNARLIPVIKSYIEECKRLNLYYEDLDVNYADRSLRLFRDDLSVFKNEFGNNYSYSSFMSYACLAEFQRHRTLNFSMERPDKPRFYVPNIIKDNKELQEEFLKDMEKVRHHFPQGELVLVHQDGRMDDFIMMMQQRECTAALYEIWNQTDEIKKKYMESLEEQNHPLKDKFKQYTRGYRCTFPNFRCTAPCKRNREERIV